MRVKHQVISFVFLLLFVVHLALVWRFFTRYEHPSILLLAVGKEVRKTYGDVIFVPGSGCNPGVGTRERLANAARYYKVSPRPIFLSEGTCSPSERATFMTYMDSLEIESKHVYWDTTSFNSDQNVRALEAWCFSWGAKSVLVSTSGFHQRRMRLLLEKKTRLEFKIAAMPDEIEMLSKLSPYKERLQTYTRSEWLKVLYLSFLTK